MHDGEISNNKVLFKDGIQEYKKYAAADEESKQAIMLRLAFDFLCCKQQVPVVCLLEFLETTTPSQEAKGRIAVASSQQLFFLDIVAQVPHAIPAGKKVVVMCMVG